MEKVKNIEKFALTSGEIEIGLAYLSCSLYLSLHPVFLTSTRTTALARDIIEIFGWRYHFYSPHPYN